jgi:hypothetical protein
MGETGLRGEGYDEDARSQSGEGQGEGAQGETGEGEEG